MIKTIEEYIEENLLGNDQKIALEFVRYLREKNLEFYKDEGACWKDKIYYWVRYNQEKCVCFIAIKDPDEPDRNWTVWSDDINSEYLSNYPIEEDLKETAWKHVDCCGLCGGCSGGKPKEIFGKKFPRVCCCTFRIDNPNESDLIFMKKMVDIKIGEIENGL